MRSVFISIDYDEGVPGTYRAVVVAPYPDGEEKRFETGDPVTDWREALPYAAAICQENGVPCMETSSVTHFAMDDPGYRFDENDMIVKVA